MAKDNTSLRFDRMLSIISITGFVGIAFASFFNLLFLQTNASSIILTLLGIGLIWEGRPGKLIRGVRNGISPNEFAKFITNITGVFIMVVGLLSFWVSGPQINATMGFASIIATLIIIVETFFVK